MGKLLCLSSLPRSCQQQRDEFEEGVRGVDNTCKLRIPVRAAQAFPFKSEQLHTVSDT